MSKKETIKTAMITAMKEKNKDRKNVLSYLLGMIQNEEINKRVELSDDEVNVIINKFVKQTEDVIKVIPSDREDLLKENNFTLEVLKEFTPKMMNEAEIRHELYCVCSELGLDVNALTGKDRGKIMGKLMPKVKGKADGSVVNKVVAEYIK